MIFLMTIYFISAILINWNRLNMAQAAESVEYMDSFSAEG